MSVYRIVQKVSTLCVGLLLVNACMALPVESVEWNSERSYFSEEQDMQITQRTSDEAIMVEWDRPLPLKGVRLERLAFGAFLTGPPAFQLEYSYDEEGKHWFGIPGQRYTEGLDDEVTAIYTFPGKLIAQRLRLRPINPETLEPVTFKSGYTGGVSKIEPIMSDELPPFESSLGGDFDARVNMFWYAFGEMSDGTYYDAGKVGDFDPFKVGNGSVIPFGHMPSWHEWMALKYSWSGSTAEQLKELRDTLLLPYPMSEDGYVWSWITQEPWPTEPRTYHQENNAKYILGCWRLWSWQRDDGFFDAVDPDTVTEPSGPSRPDVSEGMTLREKLRLAMQFLETKHHGNKGGITLQDTDLDEDGVLDNDGTAETGHPSNYWDNHHYGYWNAYDNIYYVAALEAMAELEEYWGNPERAAQLRAWREGAIKEYNEKFWDEEKGRYIACIDVNGKRWDFGMSFLNTEAVTYGLASPEQARKIYDWLDGRRIIEGETSTGADIYAWGFAPRANTIDIATTGEPYWWKSIGGAISIEPEAGNARYDYHLENGGTILYTAYYDMMGRFKYLTPDAAFERWMGIMDEFQIDQLRRDPGVWRVGTIGEFPESGLAVCPMAYGFAGLEARIDGLHISPQLPEQMQYLIVRDVTYAGGRLDLMIRSDSVKITNRADSDRAFTCEGRSVAPGESINVNVTGNSVKIY